MNTGSNLIEPVRNAKGCNLIHSFTTATAPNSERNPPSRISRKPGENRRADQWLSAVGNAIRENLRREINWTLALLRVRRRWGLVNKPPVTAPPAVRRAPRKKAAPSHAEQVKRNLLNAVADALGNAPEEIDPDNPKARISVNGSVFVIRNTVPCLLEFQSRLEKLATGPGKAPGVPLAARRFRVGS